MSFHQGATERFEVHICITEFASDAVPNLDQQSWSNYPDPNAIGENMYNMMGTLTAVLLSSPIVTFQFS